MRLSTQHAARVAVGAGWAVEPPTFETIAACKAAALALEAAVSLTHLSVMLWRFRPPNAVLPGPCSNLTQDKLAVKTGMAA